MSRTAQYSRKRIIRNTVDDVAAARFCNSWLEGAFRYANQSHATLGEALREERQYKRKVAKWWNGNGVHADWYQDVRIETGNPHTKEYGNV